MRRIETSYLTNKLLQLNRKIRKTIKKQLKLWHKNYFDFFRDIDQDKVLDEHTKLSYYKINNQCPFLNQKEKYCYVYKARPIACRMHFVESKPSLCNPKNTSGGVVRWSHSEAYTKINPALEAESNRNTTWFQKKLHLKHLIGFIYGKKVLIFY